MGKWKANKGSKEGSREWHLRRNNAFGYVLEVWATVIQCMVDKLRSWWKSYSGAPLCVLRECDACNVSHCHID